MRKNLAPNIAIEQDRFISNGVNRRSLFITRLISILLPIIVIGIAVFAFISMGNLKPEPEEKEEAIKALPVLTALAVEEDVTLSVSVQGEVHTSKQINLVPQVSGKISFISPNFIEGGQFKKGDLLLRLDSKEFELRVIQAKANIAQAETAVTREKSEGEIARRDWEDLGRSGEPTALSLRLPQLAEAQAQLESAKAQLAETELLLSRTELFAPFTGRVIERVFDTGEFVSSGTQLGSIYSTDRMEVLLPMTNVDLREAGLSLGYSSKPGQLGIPVTFSADVAGYPAKWNGHIVRTDSRFDTENRVLFVYAEVIDPFGTGADNGVPLAPGLFVNAEITGRSLSNTVRIPRAALRGNDTVYLANDDQTLKIKAVSVQSTDRDWAYLSNGLPPGSFVITSPIRGAADGMTINIVDAIDSESSVVEAE